MPITIFTPQMLRNGTRAVPEIPSGGGGGFTNIYSLEFDGVDDYVQTSTQNQTLSTQTWSASVWVNWAALSGNNEAVLSTRQNGIGTSLGIDLYMTGNNVLRARVYVGNGGYADITTTIPAIDTWYHAVITFASNTLKLYFDGGLIGSSVSVYTPSTNPLFIGKWGNGNNFHDGLIDEISIYDTELTQENITNIYNGGTPTDLSLLATPPIDWYRNGDNGAYKSPQWLIPNNENKDKVSNYSFDFDGIDDEIPIRTISQTVGTGNITYSSWIRTSKAGVYQTYQCAFGGYSNGGATYTINKLGTPFGTTDLVLWFGSSSIVLNDGNWHNIITTFDVTTKQQLSYVDGVLDRTYTAPSWITHFGICIGAGQAGQYHFEGDVSDCAVFNRVLTQLEATSIYNSGTPNDITPLTPSGYWRISDNSTFSTNWTIPDEAGSFDGTSANMTIEDRVGEAPNSENNALSFNMDEVDRVEDVPS